MSPDTNRPMNAIIPNFTETECQLMAGLLEQRYSLPVLPDLADSELRLGAGISSGATAR